MPKLSIVVPAYNEEETLELFVNEVNKQTINLPLKKTFYFINDGSTDETLKVLKKLAKTSSTSLSQETSEKKPHCLQV